MWSWQIAGTVGGPRLSVVYEYDVPARVPPVTPAGVVAGARAVVTSLTARSSLPGPSQIARYRACMLAAHVSGRVFALADKRYVQQVTSLTLVFANKS